MVEESENDEERTPGRANKSSAKANRHTSYQSPIKNLIMQNPFEKNMLENSLTSEIGS